MKTKSFKKSSSELVDETWEQVDALSIFCNSFSEGQYVVYKHMSVALRTLLIGSSRYPSLVETILPNSKFFPLLYTPTCNLEKGIITPAKIVVVNDQGGTLHYFAGGKMPYLGIEDGGIVLSKNEPYGGDVVHRTTIKNLFDISTTNRLSLDVWLHQPFLRLKWTIYSFIRCVAHKDGGAHIDNDEQLTAMKGFGNIHRHLTERISNYIVGELKFQLNQTHPYHNRIIR